MSGLVKRDGRGTLVFADPGGDRFANYEAAMGNLPTSAGNLLGGLWEAVRHPNETLQGVSDAGLGLVDKGLNRVFGRGLKPLRGEAQEQADARAAKHQEAADRFVGGYVDRYGTADRFRETARTDPLGTVLDVLGAGAAGRSLVIRGAKAAPATVDALGRAATGAKLDGVRGAVRMAASSDPVMGGRSPLPASQAIIDQQPRVAMAEPAVRPMAVDVLPPVASTSLPRGFVIDPAPSTALPETHPALGPSAAQLSAIDTPRWQSPEQFMEAERQLHDNALRDYRDLVSRSMAADPSLGPEDFRSFSDYRASYRDRMAAAASGNQAARQMMDRSAAMPMEGDGLPSLSQPLDRPAGAPRPQLMGQPLDSEQLRNIAAGVDPADVVPIASNQVGSVEEAAAIGAGRYSEALAPNERGELSRGVVRSWTGKPVNKVGPVDLVGWVRSQGGLLDQGGELSHMGLTNAPRRGMDFVGQEARFGPLVNPDGGMRLDDAALYAWEAGYFPELTERPSVNDFLDALRGTHDGYDRRFLPDDMGEIERYNAAREDRYQLAQMRDEAGAPIYVDRSVPAEGDAPFPPVEAFEDWPAGGPDFAGNINLNKLDTPQDIKRALDFTDRRVNFDAATRGKVSQVETERLAAELGMTPDKLLARRKGQAFNAEEALAARQILAKSSNELVNLAKRIRQMDNPGDDVLADFREKWLRHAAIQEQVSGATAEAGRALAQFKMVANSRAIRGDVLTALVEGGGGRDRIKDAADILVDAFEESPGRFNTMTEQLAKPRFKDKIRELYYNFLLSGPQTHAVNITSNTLTALGQFPEHVTATAIGKGRELIARKGVDRVTGTELGQRAYGMLAGVKEGLAQFARTAITGDVPDNVTKLELQSQEAISGIKGKVIRTPSRLLAAEDELFKAVARRMELHGQAARMAHKEGLRGEAAAARIADLVANPTDELLDRSLDYGRYLTFQRPLGPIASKIAAMRNDSLVMTAIAPFVRTPVNILKFAAERSPAAPLLKEWRADFRAGGARRDLAVARMVIGTGFGAAIYEAALNGTITGGAPLDPVKENFMRANGWQPYSIKIGDTYYSYSRLDPFAITIGVAADFATKREGMTERQADDYAMLLTASMLSNMADKTWLSGTADFLQALQDPQRYGKSYVRRMVAGALVPTLSAQVARTVDPVQRDVKSLPDALLARIPFASRTLPARNNIWGQPVTNEGGLGPDILSPMWTSTDKHDPVSEEMLNIGARFSMPGRSIYRDGKRVDLTPEQYEAYSAKAGQETRKTIEGMMAEPAWKELPAEAKAAAVKKAATREKKAARESLFNGAPQAAPVRGLDGKTYNLDPAKVLKSVPDPMMVQPPPEGFRVDGESGGVNIYADLQKAIPGLGLSSGYRTPEYQAQMRKRGYTPSYNSAHLSGSALDLIPPPGMSNQELRKKVKALYPNARFEDEGDHLHTTFPGYYGAPALGGAKAAGLKNPLEGMPPPPPGFTIDEAR